MPTMRPPIAMHHIPDPTRLPRDVRAVWREENSRGLDFADFADWELAAESFASAADVIATSEPMEPDAHDVLALVLGNLANACFRAGRLDDAIRHAQRACALRVALVGEDAIAVARARSDLAVMLCAAGRTDQARALIDRAVAGVEQYAGEDDLRLVVLLENGARMAMSMGAPAEAAPYLTRMHALLSVHGVPTTRADVLYDRIAAFVPAPVADETAAAVPSFADQLARGLMAPPPDTDVFRGIAFEFTDPTTPVPASTSAFAAPQSAPALGFTVEYGFAGYQRHDAPPDLDLDGDRTSDTQGIESNATAYHAPDELLLLDDASDPAIALDDGFTPEETSATEVDVSDSSGAESNGAAVAAPDGTVMSAVDAENVSAEDASAEDVASDVSTPAARERRPFAPALRAGRAAAPQRSDGAPSPSSSTLAVGAAAVWAFLRNGH